MSSGIPTVGAKQAPAPKADSSDTTAQASNPPAENIEFPTGQPTGVWDAVSDFVAKAPERATHLAYNVLTSINERNLVAQPEFKETVTRLGSGEFKVDESVNALYALANARDVQVAGISVGPKITDARLGLLGDLLNNRTASEVNALIQKYTEKYGRHPEFDLRSDGLGQALNQLPTSDEVAAVGILNRAQTEEVAKLLKQIHENPNPTIDDRRAYFAALPMLGLWAPSARERDMPGTNLDAPERAYLKSALANVFDDNDIQLEKVLEGIESKLQNVSVPESSLPREKTIAVLASSHGAQWQEAMDFAVKMQQEGYHVQFFSPDGRPVGFQRDSLNVSTGTVELGLGAPPHLNPLDPKVSAITNGMLGDTRPAMQFDASKYGMVYLAGGLGFNEDVAKATPMSDQDFDALSLKDQAKQNWVEFRDHTTPVKLELNPNVKTLLDRAVNENLALVTLCHGATVFSAYEVEGKDGMKVPFNKDLSTSSLPPLEWFVRMRGSVSAPFVASAPNLSTHGTLDLTGGDTAVWSDLLNTSRLVADVRHTQHGDIQVLSGAAPPAALPLANEVLANTNKYIKR